MNVIPLFSLIYLTILFGGCSREETFIPVHSTIISFPTTDRLNCFTVLPTGSIHVGGGLGWESGTLQHSSDEGQSWQSDLFPNAEIQGMAFNDKGEGRCVGKSGTYFFYSATTGKWDFVRLPFWENLAGIALHTDGFSLAGGGSAWERGFICRISSAHTLIQIDTFPNEIASLCFADSNVAFAVGYGVVLRSRDAGTSWEFIDLTGDFFTDICFPVAQRGFIIGENGLIARSLDAGDTWQIVRKPATLPGKSPGLRSVDFLNDRVGYICGDAGLLWITEDGGSTWGIASNLPEIDFLNVQAVSPGGYLSGDDGTLLWFE